MNQQMAYDLLANQVAKFPKIKRSADIHKVISAIAKRKLPLPEKITALNKHIKKQQLK